LFNGLPIVFLGVNNQENALKAYNFPQITGVIEQVSIKETIDIGLTLQDETQNIYVIVDSTTTGQSDLARLKNLISSYPNDNFRIFDASEMTFDQLALKLKGISSSDLLLFLSLYRDKTGDSFLFSESVDFVLENSNVPIIHIYKYGIGEGMLGGHVVDHYQQGYLAGTLVKDYFNRGSLEGFPVIEKKSKHLLF